MTKPNIVFILSDDHGTWSLKSYGNEDCICPTLDNMAKNGTRFENFFCTSPVCSPARASIMTGKMPSQHGVLDWLGGGSVKKDDYRGKMIPLKKSLHYLNEASEDTSNISDADLVSFEETHSFKHYMEYELGGVEFMKDHLCYTEVLKQHGYTCGLSGKWHLGNSYVAQKGFDYWEVIARGATNYMLPEYVRNGKIKLETRYATNIITDDAITFLNSRNEEPFYLSVHYTAPHDPWDKRDQPEDIWKLYDDCAFSSLPDEPLNPNRVDYVRYPKSEEQKREFQQGYFTTITAMDRGIKRIIDTLEATGKLDNTIIIFTGDNGFNLGHHGIWGKGNATTPLNMYETSVKVPFIACGKGVAKGRIASALVSQYDIFPTILDIAGIPAQEHLAQMAQLPGSSFIGLLDGSQEKHREEVVVYDEYGPARMIRDERYKLIYRHPYGPHELYDLTSDPDEKNNLIALPALRDKKVELYNRLTSWFEKYSTPEHSGINYPVDGKGQMEALEKFKTGKVVFKSF